MVCSVLGFVRDGNGVGVIFLIARIGLLQNISISFYTKEWSVIPTDLMSASYGGLISD